MEKSDRAQLVGRNNKRQEIINILKAKLSK